MIMGIDGSLSSTGWNVYDEIKKDVVDLGKICTKKKTKGDNPEEEDERIAIIVKELVVKCKQYGITQVVMEGQFVDSKNLKVGLQLSRLRGAIMMAFKIYGIKTIYEQPSEVKKKLTGKGNAKKEAVAENVIALYKENTLVTALGPFIDKACKAKNSDIYDSIAITTAHYL